MGRLGVIVRRYPKLNWLVRKVPLADNLHDYLYAEDEVSGESLQRSHQVLDWNKHPETQRLMEFLRVEIDKPSQLGDHVSMISETARGNVFKALIGRLRVELANAERAVEESTDV